MALVCDIKSNAGNEEVLPQEEQIIEDDLEDGEIEDDEDELSTEPEAPPPQPPAAVNEPIPIKSSNSTKSNNSTNERPEKDKIRDRSERRSRHEEKGRKHMTEAEKSILHLRKREKLQREKWEKFRKEHGSADPLDDDFAKNIEKTLATILSKKEKQAAGLDDEKEEEKRGRKRKKNDKDNKKSKQRRAESPKLDGMDESEMTNVRGVSPDNKRDDRSLTPRSDESFDSEYSSDRSKSEEKSRKRGKRGRRNREHRDRNKNRERDRERRVEPQLKDAQGVCVFYLQGKCQKNDCPYSHEAVPPMKLELCKFYLMGCCAKGEKCSYMHSEFPCKFYHTGLQCTQGDNCKFAHGKPLSEGLKQILFKHIETAPRDILGGFPRMSREEALNMINISQKNLQEQFGMAEPSEDGKNLIPSLFDINVPVPLELMQGSDETTKPPEKTEKPPRNRRSRWQDPDPEPPKILNFPLKPFSFGQDQDMRINSNGDIDMRTLPPAMASLGGLPLNSLISSTPEVTTSSDVDKKDTVLIPPVKQDVDIRNTNMLPLNAKDVDIRPQTTDPRLLASKDVDIRQLPGMYEEPNRAENSLDEEPMLQIDTGEPTIKLPSDLPKTQRDLYLRIQAQQKDNSPEEDKSGFQVEENINWYSDDDDDDENRLTIKVDNEDGRENEKEQTDSDHIMSPPQIKSLDVVEKLGDLSKIDISAEVTKLLTSMSQSKNQVPNKEVKTPTTPTRDPRMVLDPRSSATSSPSTTFQDPRLTSDPRRTRHSSTDSQTKTEKISIYEQGSIDSDKHDEDNVDLRTDIDFRGGRSDVDLRSLQLPFKGMQNYTPATEIDASINSHVPIIWKVAVVEIPRPDYTGLKLSVSDAEKTGDPRLRKIFRLSIDEKDSPASPKASPKASGTRVDPRLRKIEEPKMDSGSMNYNQQLTALQSSAFYQSLTSNQKVLLNQELAARADQSGCNDPVLNSLLSNLNIIPNANLQGNPNLGTALNILSKLNPILTQAAPNAMQVNPAILGQNQNLMNQMAQSIVQPGLLGAAPGIPNLPPDFPINFDPRNGGLLGNAPPPFENFNQDGPGNFGGNFNDDFYPPDNGGGNFVQHNNSGNNNRFMRDRRRGRSNFNRNNGNRNFRNRNNRSNNRSHTPP